MEASRFATAIERGHEEEGLEDRDGQGSTALHVAAKSGHTQLVAMLLSKGAQVNVKDKDGTTPLMTAMDVVITEGHMAVVEMLLKHLDGEGLEARDEQGRTAMHLAAKCYIFDEKPRTQLVAMLLDKGAQVNVKDKDGKTPLMLAMRRAGIEVAQMLVKHMDGEGLKAKDESEQGRTALHLAVSWGQAELVTLMLKKGAPTDIKDNYGLTPLMWAINGRMGEYHMAVLEMLLEPMKGEGLEARDEQGRTAMHLAAQWGHVQLVAMLLSKGAQVDVKDKDGNTPLMVAIGRGRIEMARVLLEYTEVEGLEARDEQGRTALHLAASSGRAELVTSMLKKGPQANIRDKDGMTPLMTAISGCHMDVVQMLLKHLGGQGLEERNDKGRTALHLVAECHCSDEETRTQLVDVLLSKGAQVDVKDEDGITPLLIALGRGRVEMARMLLEYTEGEGLEARDKQGRTAMHVAARSGHAELVTSMLKKGVQPIPKDDYGLTPLMRAISGSITEGHMAVVEMLLQRMEGEGLEAKDEQGRTALHLAAKCRLTDEKTCTQLVAMLLKKGAQVDVKDKDGNTPLMVAIKRYNIEVARMLLEHMEGEGLEEKDEQGRTAMHLAASDCAYDILALNFLLEHGAMANVKDGNGVTPLMNAALGGSLTGVQLLVQHVGEQGLQERDQEGRTVLHCAIGGSATPLGAIRFYYDGTFSTMVQALLEAGADPSITDTKGRTPRALAMEIGLQRCGGLCERGEDERRRYLLQRARCLHDTYTTHRDAPGAPVPAFLQDRAAAGQALPILEVEGVQEEQQQAPLVYAVTHLNEQLFTELIGGFHVL